MSWSLLLLALAGPAGAAGTSARAELARLDEEMILLVEKSAWGGVERAYLQMKALDGKGGAKLGWEHHRLGALAAQARGDVLETWRRVRAAEAIESHEETLMWLARLEATHGRVVVELSPLVFGGVPLEALDPFSDPGAPKVVQAAQKQLDEHHFFDGLLPLGRYRVGTVRFDVDGGPLVQVAVAPGQAKSPPVAQAPGTLRLVATAAPPSSAEFAKAAELASEAARSVSGVTSVEVLPLPGQRIYAEFGEGTLEVLGLTAEQVAEQVRADLAAAATGLTVSANAVGVPAGEVKLERFSQVPIRFGDGSANLGALARVREAADHTAQPPGLEISLAPGTDPATAQAAILEKVAQEPGAAGLGLTRQ